MAEVAGHGQTVSDVSEWVLASLSERVNCKDGDAVLVDLNRLAIEHG